MLSLRPTDWQHLFGIDLRSLALFRVLIALTCIIEIAHGWPEGFALFDDNGIYPPHEAMSWNNNHFWSLYYVSGSVLWARFLLSLTVFCSLALLVGYQTRLMTFLCWMLMVSYHNRILIFIHGGHMLLIGLLFWAMFLPLGAKFSIDSALNTSRVKSNAYFSAATFAILIQMMCLYLFSALLKTDPRWYSSGEAIYYVLNTTSMPTFLGVYLGQWPTLTHYLTLYVYYLELIAAAFLFFPYKNASFRLFILPFLITLHLGFLLFLSIGIFPFVCIAGLALFIPGRAWNVVLDWFNNRPVRKNIVIYYDAPCVFCRKICLILKELGLPPQTAILPAQDYPEAAQILQREQTWVVQDSVGQYHTHWDAVAWCWRRSPLLWPLGILFLPRIMQKLGNQIYQLIARHRAQLAKLTERFFAFTSQKLDAKPSFFTQCIMFILIGGLVLLHIKTLPAKSHPSALQDYLLYHLEATLQPLGLNQEMNFFAPFPLHIARWIVIEGTLKNGEIVDLLRQKDTAPSGEKPANAYRAYPNHYWFKFFHRISYNAEWERVIGHYYCYSWSQNHAEDQALVSMKLTVYEQETVLPKEKVPSVKQSAVLHYKCSE